MATRSATVFINYRKTDVRSVASRLDRDLGHRFGPDKVFRDQTRLHGGDDWAKELEANVRCCRVMLVVIGPAWEHARFDSGDFSGSLRLHDPKDWVRREIALALELEKVVVPVLVDNAKMPSASWLSKFDLSGLAEKQGMPLDGDDHYESNLDQIVALLKARCTDLVRLSPRDLSSHDMEEALRTRTQRQILAESSESNPSGTVRGYAQASVAADGCAPVVASNVPLPLAYVVHRPDITAAIHEALLGSRGVACLVPADANASVGNGKSVAAQLYAQAHAAEYPGGRFLLSMEAADLALALAQLAPRLGISGAIAHRNVPGEVKRVLENGPSSLLILDNVPDAKRWTEFSASDVLPGGACRVIVTTRSADIMPNAAVRVPRFTTDEAWVTLARFRADALDGGNVEWVGRVLRATAGLPVIVAAVGARLKLTGSITWAQYWGMLAKRAPALFSDSALPPLVAPTDAKSDTNQQTRWGVLIDDAINAFPSAELRALQYAALLPPDMAPRLWLELLLAGSDVNTGSEQAIEHLPGGNRVRWAGAVLERLIGLDVLRRAGEEGRILTLHRLWRERVQASIADQSTLLEEIHQLAAVRGRVLYDEWHSSAHHWELNPLRTLAETVAREGRWREAWSIYSGIGPPLGAAERHEEGWRIISLIDPVAQAAGSGAELQERVEIKSSLGFKAWSRDDYAVALSSMDEALKMARGHLADTEPLIGSIRSERARILLNMGELDEARSCVHSLPGIPGPNCDATTWEQRTNIRHIAECHMNMAMVLLGTGEIGQARELGETGVRLVEAVVSKDDPDVGMYHANYSEILRGLGLLQEAQAHIDEALVRSEAALGQQHPQQITLLVASAVNALARAQWARERQREETACIELANNALERAVAIVARTADVRISDLVDLHQVRAELAQFLDHEAQALEAVNAAVASAGQGDSVAQACIPQFMLQRASIYKDRQSEAVVQNIRDAVAAASRTFATQRLSLIGILCEAAKAHSELERHREAGDLLEQAEAILDAKQDWSARPRGLLAMARGRHLLNRGKQSGGQEFFNQALRPLERWIADTPSTDSSLWQLRAQVQELRGSILTSMGLPDSAIRAYELATSLHNQCCGGGIRGTAAVMLEMAMALLQCADKARECRDLRRAEGLYREAADLLGSYYEVDHVEVARALKGLAVALIEQERWLEALPVARRATGIFARLPAGDDEETAMSNREVAVCLYRLGTRESSVAQIEEARRLIYQCRDVIARVCDSEHASSKLIAASLREIAGE